MSLTLKDLNLRFKRYQVKPTVSEYGLRAIRVTNKNMASIFRYIEGLGFDKDVEYDPTKNKFYIYQYRASRLALGGTRIKRNRYLVRAGDWIVQFHSGVWEKLSQEAFDDIVEKRDETPGLFHEYSFTGLAFPVYDFYAAEVVPEHREMLVKFVNENGGRATVSERRSGDIRIKQLTFGENWSKMDWRVAEPGDYLVWHKPTGDWERIKKAVFESSFTR